jgi:tight adherence protein B
MASASGGRVTASASAADLAAAFSAAARTFASQVVLDIAIPASDHGRTAELRVTLESSIGQLHAETSLRIGGTSVPSTDAEDPSTPPSPQKTPIELLVLVFAALCVPLIALLVAVERRGSPQGRTKRLLHRYTLKPEGPVAQNEAAASGRLGGLTSWVLSVADRVTANPARRDKLVTRLTRADVSLTPGEWVAIRSIVAFTSGALATVVFGSLVAGLLLAVLGFFASNAWLSIKGRRRLRAFDEYLPASLQLVASSLRTGFSLPQALDGVVREGLEPIAGEFNRALSEARLGMPIEDALDAVSDRMASTDFRWVVMAIRIQREVGGNLAEILLNTAMMMRERAKLRRQVKALSAEGRLSAYVLLALPLLMSLYMFALRRAYIRPLYTTGLGLGMLILAIVLVVAGMFWMRKVVRVEV